MIDKQTIDKIFSTLNIIDVLSDFIHLKKRGANYLALCPFHHEKTPSFSVSPTKGIYKCFGCGKAGNAVNFIMEHEHLSYAEALKWVAKKYHIEITESHSTPEDVEKLNEIESMLIVTGYAQRFYTDILYRHNEGKTIGLSYLSERGISEQMAMRFQLGYSPDDRDVFTREALRNGYNIEYLVKTGLTIRKDNNYTMDRFFGRIIFPIHSLSGKVIGFGGRILKKVENTAKYLNSPESDIYHKSQVLYGLYFARNEIVKQDKCFLVEGYTDVIAMHQSGVENVVASSGTSLTTEQIKLIKRFTNNLTILYDGDPAGIKASLRGIDMILEEGLNVKVILLPDGDDPDSFSKKHSPTELYQFISQNEKDFITFKTELLLKQTAGDPIAKAGLIADIAASIAVIPDIIIRSVYIRECSRIMSIDERVLYADINKKRRKIYEDKIKNSGGDFVQQPDTILQQKPFLPPVEEIKEREIIRILLNYGNKELYRNTVRNEFGEEEIHTETVAGFIVRELLQDDLRLLNPLYSTIFDHFANAESQGLYADEKYFIHHDNQELSKTAIDILSSSYTSNDLSKIWKKHDTYIDFEDMILKELVPNTIQQYKLHRLTLMEKKLMDKLTAAQSKTDNLEEIKSILEQLKTINNIRVPLAHNLQRTTL